MLLRPQIPTFSMIMIPKQFQKRSLLIIKIMVLRMDYDFPMCDLKAWQTYMCNDSCKIFMKQVYCPKQFGVFQVTFRITLGFYLFV